MICSRCEMFGSARYTTRERLTHVECYRRNGERNTKNYNLSECEGLIANSTQRSAWHIRQILVNQECNARKKTSHNGGGSLHARGWGKNHLEFRVGSFLYSFGQKVNGSNLQTHRSVRQCTCTYHVCVLTARGTSSSWNSGSTGGVQGCVQW